MATQLSEEIARTFPTTKKLREETAKLLASGEDLAFKEIQGSNFEKLKEKIRTGKI